MRRGMLLGYPSRRHGRRGRIVPVLPASPTPTSSSSLTSGPIPISEPAQSGGEGDMQFHILHRMYLAVNAKGTFKTVHKIFGENQDDGAVPAALQHYVYNTAIVPLEMSMVDRRMHPLIYDALKESETSFLELVFNGPKEDWEQLDFLPLGEIRPRNNQVRIRVKENAFFKLLYKDYRFNVCINLDGFVYRPDFRRGRPHPLSLDETKMLEVAVDEGGTSEEISGPMCAALFGDHQLLGKFTVELQWNGPEMSFDCTPLYKRLVEDAPKDVTFVLDDGGTFQCNSSLIKSSSPVFNAMLNSNMIEAQTGKIQLPDVGAPVIQAFVTFLENGTLVEPFRNSEVCFNLFVFSNKYDISVLENAAKNLLQGKPARWMDTGTALELYCFLNGFPNLEELHAKAKEILRSRKEEVGELNRYQELLQEDPKFAEGIFGKPNLVLDVRCLPKRTLQDIDEDDEDWDW